MEEGLICPQCHVNVRPTDYFCFNCGKNLRPQLLSTSFSAQFWIYLKSIFLPPLGLVLGIRYLKQPSRAAKTVGLVAIALTVVVLVVTIRATLNFVNAFNRQLGTQLQDFQGL